jgi:hypothetical protein
VADAGLPYEEWISIHDLKYHATCRPYINLSTILGGSKNKLGSSIASSTNVGDVVFFRDEYFGRTKVADDGPVAFEQNILRFDVSMADVEGMEIAKAFEELIDDDLFLEVWHFSNRITLDSLKKVFLIVAHTDVQIVVLALSSHIGPIDLAYKIVI